MKSNLNEKIFSNNKSKDLYEVNESDKYKNSHKQNTTNDETELIVSDICKKTAHDLNESIENIETSDNDTYNFNGLTHEIHYYCKFCEFVSKTQKGMKIHSSKMHKNYNQKSKSNRDDILENFQKDSDSYSDELKESNDILHSTQDIDQRIDKNAIEKSSENDFIERVQGQDKNDYSKELLNNDYNTSDNIIKDNPNNQQLLKFNNIISNEEFRHNFLQSKRKNLQYSASYVKKFTVYRQIHIFSFSFYKKYKKQYRNQLQIFFENLNLKNEILKYANKFYENKMYLQGILFFNLK